MISTTCCHSSTLWNNSTNGISIFDSYGNAIMCMHRDRKNSHTCFHSINQKNFILGNTIWVRGKKILCDIKLMAFEIFQLLKIIFVRSYEESDTGGWILPLFNIFLGFTYISLHVHLLIILTVVLIQKLSNFIKF